MVDLDELLHSLVDDAAEATLDGHVDHCWLDVVLGHPLQALQFTVTAAARWLHLSCAGQEQADVQSGRNQHALLLPGLHEIAGDSANFSWLLAVHALPPRHPAMMRSP